MNNAKKVAVLLGLNGLVIASQTLLARQAGQAGVPPLVFAFASAAGAALFLGCYRSLSGKGRPLGQKVVLYGSIAGLISIALPQFLIYSASAYVSAGIASLAYAFPTPFTYVLAALFGIEKPSLGRTLGIGIALTGAIGLALTRSSGMSGEGFWIALAMLAPVIIASGNIYRTRFWPPGAEPIDLAFAMTSAASLWLLLALGVTALAGGPVSVTQPEGYWYLLASAAIAAFGNVIYFELQRSGGIVSFSQIGYIGAVLGLIGGAVLLSERYELSTWIAAGVIALGVAISEILKRRAAQPQP